jgi:cold shock CspA family protein
MMMYQQTQGEYFGTIKSWNPQKGWGHIESETTHAIYEKDIFVMRSAIPGGHVTIGDQVRFAVTDGQKGPEACNVVIVSPIAAASGQFPGQSLFGFVKSYDAEKGWGHITCDQTRNWYGKDMFFLKSSLMGQNVEAGSKVRFNLGMGAKGVEAQSIQLVGVGKSPGFQGQYIMGGYQAYQAPKIPTPAGAQRFSGMVKNWNIEKGWGFIQCPETTAIYGKDIFLHRNQLFGQAPGVGAPLEFSVQLGEDGRLIATGVRFKGGQNFAAQSQAYNRVTPY